jgi:large subunit ribosomal protein L9
MARTLELLLTENVEGTGIVGDVVKVRKGYARNYLMPRNFATTPSPEKVKDLATKREEAQRQLAALRNQGRVQRDQAARRPSGRRHQARGRLRRPH